jgi:NADPH:quinone reductase-like Zn-dependent oxidoreductase
MAAAAQAYRFARYGSIGEVLQLQKFAPAITNGASQVLIEPKIVPVHRTEAAIVNGTAANTTSTSFPKTAGFEGLAVVADAASNKSNLKNGDWVYVLPSDGAKFAGTWCNKNVVSTDILVPVQQAAVSGNPLASCLSCFLTASALLDNATSASALAKGDVVVQNGGSSLTSLAVSALGKQRGLKIVTAASAGPRFAAAEKRHKALGSEVVQYDAEGARKAAKIVGATGAKAFFNGVGGRAFNDFLKLAGEGNFETRCITYGAQNSYGLTFAGSQLVFRNITLKGFYLPRYLQSLSEKERIAKVNAALELAKELKGQYPVEIIKNLEGLPAVWDKLYVEGGSKGVIQF